ncbi:MAG: hypothetical protein LBV68_08990 [Spirochaetaceae bacterium]|jgi:hypothetical protein|nr:hypothetical protein [Spirochaetaceae bacterium]
MKIVWKRDAGRALCAGREFIITSIVRNELNGRRKLHNPDDVVNTVKENGTWGAAYMPCPFPKGTWEITGMEKIKNRYSRR